MKHNIDKRIVHYSALIRSTQITREDALLRINNLPYDINSINQEKEYICKKLEISIEEFENILKLPVRNYKDYKTYDNFKRHLNPIINFLKKKKLWPTIA